MQYLDLTAPSAADNLACDEALLDACENDPRAEVLRFWEPREHFVVVGYANEVAREVDDAACARAGVGIFRRCSGGGTVLQGPGCLNYSLVFRFDSRPYLQSITSTNCYIMTRQAKALSKLLGREVEVNGITDLSLDGLKFSGNAQRRKRNALIFHGTFLLRFDLALMEQFLKMPSREPEYREGRPHGRFLTNLDLDASAIKQALRDAWDAQVLLADAPDYAALAAEKYARADWNLKF